MIEVQTPCRLHFGLLAFGAESSRQFGGVGVMVKQPDLAVRISAAEVFSASGAMAEKAQGFAQRAARLGGWDQAAKVEVIRAPRAHTGLGTGTQLGMAIARGMGALAGEEAMAAETLASLSGRGQRSAIGAHGFLHGGLIVEGGKSEPDALSPLLLRKPFPEQWRFVVITPRALVGLSDRREREAFAGLGTIPQEATDRMCRLVLLGLVPALVERDVRDFGEALYELQQVVGGCFAAAQGGVYADPLLAEIVSYVRQGCGGALPGAGVGQSSWGPTLYAVAGDAEVAERMAGDVAERFGLGADEVVVTEADNDGGRVVTEGSADSLRSSAGIRGGSGGG